MWRTALVLLLAVAACHAGMHDTSLMRDYLEDARLETARHQEAARGASTMQHMRDEMDRHRRGMAPMMDGMDIAMDGMASHCDGLGEMREMHGGMEAEMAGHLATMEASSELAAAMAEVERHAAAMTSMMDGMNGAMGHMRCH